MKCDEIPFYKGMTLTIPRVLAPVQLFAQGVEVGAFRHTQQFEVEVGFAHGQLVGVVYIDGTRIDGT